MMSWIAVALGGALGAMSRYGIALAMQNNSWRFPFGTLLPNLLGAIAIGVLYVLVVEKMVLSERLHPLLMVGFLGGLTTFSSFSLEAVQLFMEGRVNAALAYIMASVLGCLLCAWLAITVTRTF